MINEVGYPHFAHINDQIWFERILIIRAKPFMNSCAKIRGINKVDCIESLMTAYQSKIDIFEEMRHFLMMNFTIF